MMGAPLVVLGARTIVKREFLTGMPRYNLYGKRAVVRGAIFVIMGAAMLFLAAGVVIERFS
jgi:hypothetical protein